MICLFDALCALFQKHTAYSSKQKRSAREMSSLVTAVPLQYEVIRPPVGKQVAMTILPYHRAVLSGGRQAARARLYSYAMFKCPPPRGRA